MPFIFDALFSFHLAKAAVYPSGLIIWEPPMIYKSSCPINVQYFPFGKLIEKKKIFARRKSFTKIWKFDFIFFGSDEQICSLKLGSWT